MKNFKIVLFALLASFFFACDAGLSITTINLDVLNKDNEVSNGEKLRLKLKVKDSEGIAFILIKIPVLNAERKIEDFSDDNKWEFEEHFVVDDLNVNGEFEVFVTVVDKAGEEYIDTEKFTVE